MEHARSFLGVQPEGFSVVEDAISSGDFWNEEQDRIRMIREKYNTRCEECELFSVAQACFAFNVPWIGLRVLSNNSTNGGTYTPEAGVNSQIVAVKIARKILRDMKLV